MRFVNICSENLIVVQEGREGLLLQKEVLWIYRDIYTK